MNPSRTRNNAICISLFVEFPSVNLKRYMGATDHLSMSTDDDTARYSSFPAMA